MRRFPKPSVLAVAAVLVVTATSSFAGGVWGWIAGTAVAAGLGLLWLRLLRGELDRRGLFRRSGEYRRARRNASPEDWSALPADCGRAVDRLVADHDRILSILDGIHDGVIALDRGGRVLLMNRTMQRTFAVASTEWFGRSLASLFENPALNDFARQTLESRESDRREIRHDGRIFEVRAEPVETFTRLVLVLRDVTEMRRLETMRRDFVANVSHELKTPLTSIRAYVETLLEGGMDDSEVNLRFTRKIDANTGRLSALISDLLTLSRIESGKAVTHRLPLDLGGLLEEVVQGITPSAEEKDIAIDVAIDGDSLEVYGEAEACRQVFDNLAGNAVKYTEPGGRVTIRAHREADAVRVDIEDTGIGIPEEDLPRVFERFYRVDKARSREKGGTGLGLSIVKHYVEALDGRIEVASRQGAGTTFTVRLPRPPRAGALAAPERPAS